MSWFSTTVLSFFRIGVEFPHSAEISGIVGGVSADVTTEQRTGMIYYAARIAIEPHEIARPGDVKLVPGMPVEAFIKTGAVQGGLI
jgi:hypothetical protein